MPLDIQSLLEPISVAEAGGADLRYDPVTIEIREARRQEEDISSGVWKREVKTADYPRVVHLACETLRRRSKDLQIAAWLTEALLFQEGLAGLRQGLELIQGLLDRFWDSVHPQADEDGNLELRAAALAWVATQLNGGVRSVPLNSGGHDWLQYRRSCSVPTEDQANSDSAKQELRQAALEDGAIAPEEFEKALEATPTTFYEKLYEDLSSLLKFTQSLGRFCDEKFGDDSPEFLSLRLALEDVQQTVRVLGKKRGAWVVEPVAAPAQVAAPLAEAREPYAPPADVPVEPSSSFLGEPSSPQEAIQRIVALARYLRQQTPWSPVPYLITRAVRWGELRGQGGQPDRSATPPGPLADELEHLAIEGAWDEIMEIAEGAAAEPYARAWLDLDRYVVTVCRGAGNQTAAAAIVAGLKALVHEFPRLPDSAPANSETRLWVRSETQLSPEQQTRPVLPSPDVPTAESNGAEPTAYDLARVAAASGRIEEALDLLDRDVAGKHSGRDRFFARIRLARLCLETGNSGIGVPILEDLAKDIQQHSLENWEANEVVVDPLALLYQSLENGEASDERRRNLYARICCLSPARALALARA